MRRLNLALIACLQLCSAKHHSFSIHDDVLAYPQFEVVFSEAPIDEARAQALLNQKTHQSQSYEASFSHSDLSSQPQGESVAAAQASHHNEYPSDADDDSPQISETYELLHLPPARYLCSIPVLAPPPPPNETATELAKAEEARELSRASEKGWQLMSGLDGQCLFYHSGWWSYSFCYGAAVIQFHALPGAQGGQPVKDPASQEYILGQGHKAEKESDTAGHNSNGEVSRHQSGQIKEQPANTDMLVKGDQRYLVQRLADGTICDLTGRERTIEIQYHCNPGAKYDRINWIKEVTTCTYLMEVRTPRLCEDVAFQPPKPTRAHPISCRMVVGTEEEAASWHKQKTLEAHEAMGVPLSSASEKHNKDGSRTPLSIGGVVVGGKRAAGMAAEDNVPPPKLQPPKGWNAGRGKVTAGKLVEILATGKSKAKGGDVEVLPDEVVEELQLDPDTVQALKEQLQKIAGDEGWRLEVVEGPGQVRDIRGMVGDMDQQEEGQEYRVQQPDGEQGQSKETKGAQQHHHQQQQGEEKEEDANNNGGGGEDGSEEQFFKDEL